MFIVMDHIALSGSVFLDFVTPDCHVVAASKRSVFREFDRRENEAPYS